MSRLLSKECVSLLSAIITEICDDSEDEDLLPFKAIEESCAKDEEYFVAKKKPKKTGSIYEPHVHYSRPSRFEKADILTYPDVEESNETEICKKSLKPLNLCLCCDHRNSEAFKPIVVNEVDSTALSDSDFKAHWRMARSTVETVYTLVQTDRETPNVSISEFLAVLWKLTSSEELEAIETMFKISREEIASLERTVFEALLNKRFEFERWPRGKAADETMAGFLSLGSLPALLGAIDCVHFPCNGAPYAGTYLNQNNDKTIMFQLGCDHRGSFTHSSYFWWPGKWRVEHIYDNSGLSSLPMPEGAYLAGTRAYAEYKHFIAPFVDTGKLSDVQKEFNMRHSKAMQVLRDAVMGLASRFATVRYFKIQNRWVLRKQFATCLLLHNICVEHEDFIESDLIEMEGFEAFPPPVFQLVPDVEAVQRDIICSQIKEDLGQ